MSFSLTVKCDEKGPYSGVLTEINKNGLLNAELRQAKVFFAITLKLYEMQGSFFHRGNGQCGFLSLKVMAGCLKTTLLKL